MQTVSDETDAVANFLLYTYGYDKTANMHGMLK